MLRLSFVLRSFVIVPQSAGGCLALHIPPDAALLVVQFIAMKKHYRPISAKNIKTYQLACRQSKVSREAVAAPYREGMSFREFVSTLPEFLGASDLKAVAAAIAHARRAGRPVILGMGAHPIKVGLSPLIIDLMERGIITAIAGNGACIVHDFELCYAGHTSEDVAAAIQDGSFGMARETAAKLNGAIKTGVRKGLGLGASVGKLLHEGKFTRRGPSIFATAYRLKLPATVHVAIGTDIIHMHPSADGAAIGEGSLRDFRLLASVVSDLSGGVYLNLGSAVVLPEVFLKALTLARNLSKSKVEGFTTVSMDFIQHYRVRENVLRRPTLGKGTAYCLTGHHEIMFPLLAAMVTEHLRK